MLLRQIKNVFSINPKLLTINRLLTSTTEASGGSVGGGGGGGSGGGSTGVIGTAATTLPILEKWKTKFIENKVPEIDSSLKNILAHVLEFEQIRDLETKKWKLSEPQQVRFDELCECRMARMPIQYIIGEWEFRDLTLKMKPPVFIPRPETEELVELVLQQFDISRSMRFLEIGCGSGAICVTLLKSLPKSVCTAIDQSQLACDLTMTNAELHKVNGRLKIKREKLTPQIDLNKFDNSLDLIVSNPPYVPNADLVRLAPEIKLYEDLRALDGGVDGMDVIKSIFLLASKKLRPKGVLWLEVDPRHPQIIKTYLEKNIELELKFVASYQDFLGRERFVEIVKT